MRRLRSTAVLGCLLACNGGGAGVGSETTDAGGTMATTGGTGDATAGSGTTTTGVDPTADASGSSSDTGGLDVGGPDAPLIFNAPGTAAAGDVVYLQGAAFGSDPVVLLNESVPLETLAVVDDVWTAVRLPLDATPPLSINVGNGLGWSLPVRLGAATPWHLDAVTLAPGGAFRVFGRNLAIAGHAPVVTVEGLPASVDVAASSAHVLVCVAPRGLQTGSAATITVDNGGGHGPAILDRTIAIDATGDGDPFALGVGWGAAFDDVAQAVTVVDALAPAADNTATIQAALDERGDEGGGVVRLPAGSWPMSGTLDLPSGVVLQGAGKRATTLRYDSPWVAIGSYGRDRIGVMDLTLHNDGADNGPLVINDGTRVFLRDVRFELGSSGHGFLAGNRDLAVRGCEFVQAGRFNGQGPYTLGGSAGVSFRENTHLSWTGAPDFENVHDADVSDNVFTRDAARQQLMDQSDGVLHGSAWGFTHHTYIGHNVFETVNGPVLPADARNDGEQLLTEGGGGARTENLGVVTDATATTLTDVTNAFDDSPGNFAGMPENYEVWIVAGRGVGQRRRIVAIDGDTLTVAPAWDVVPDGSSRYASFVTFARVIIEHNAFEPGGSRGIWIYQAAANECDITDNALTNSGTIYLRQWHDLENKQLCPQWNLRVAGNTVAADGGTNSAAITSVFVNRSPPFGVASLGLVVTDNRLVANDPDYASGNMDLADRFEGYASEVFYEGVAYEAAALPMVLGPVFQRNDATHPDAWLRLDSGVEHAIVQPGALDDAGALLNQTAGGAPGGASVVEP